MKYDAPISPVSSISSARYAPYTTSSLTSSATTSAASVWSDASSQSSDDTSISAPSSDSESCESRYNARTKFNVDHLRNVRPTVHQQPMADVVPAELRQNPRRTASGPHSKAICPPTLVRQSDRKVNFVDSLVGRSHFDRLRTASELALNYFTSRFIDSDRRSHLAPFVCRMPQ
jgi:hypothetical protein